VSGQTVHRTHTCSACGGPGHNRLTCPSVESPTRTQRLIAGIFKDKRALYVRALIERGSYALDGAQITALRAYARARQTGAPFTKPGGEHHATMLVLEALGLLEGKDVGRHIYWSTTDDGERYLKIVRAG